jgi:hypothetical protein
MQYYLALIVRVDYLECKRQALPCRRTLAYDTKVITLRRDNSDACSNISTTECGDSDILRNRYIEADVIRTPIAWEW